VNQAATPFADLLRTWRSERRISQLELATEADISQKHLSFIETGRAAPSRDLVLLLAERLDVPLRERNTFLIAAGYAPLFRDRPLTDPALAPVLTSIERLLKAHEPYPAVGLDRHWNLVVANASVAPLLAGVDPELLKPPVNVLRLSMHPRGLKPRIINFDEWADHLLHRARRQLRITRDRELGALLLEMTSYNADVPSFHRTQSLLPEEVVVPLKLRTQGAVLSLLSTVTAFGTAVDITVSELTLESFYPADEETRALLQADVSGFTVGKAV